MDLGVIVDLETTGLDFSKDKIIEIGLLEFSVRGGEMPVITGIYSGVEDPGISLTEVVSKITGLKDEHLRDRRINWDLVKRYFSSASLVIAHNMDFDRPFLQKRPEISDLVKQAHWACSMRHIDWKSHDFNTRALVYLAAEHGFVNPFPHRAIFDCATTFKIIAPRLEELIRRSYEREFKFAAVDAPYEKKDELKSRGYSWDKDRRCWMKTIPESAIQEERKFLADVIYQGAARHIEELLTN